MTHQYPPRAEGSDHDEPRLDPDSSTPFFDLSADGPNPSGEGSAASSGIASRAVRLVAAAALGALVWLGSGLLANQESNEVETSAPEIPASSTSTTEVPESEPLNIESPRPLSNPGTLWVVGAPEEQVTTSSSLSSTTSSSTVASTTTEATTTTAAPTSTSTSTEAPAPTPAPRQAAEAPVVSAAGTTPAETAAPATKAPAATSTTATPAAASNANYQQNLSMIKASSARNTNHDSSRFRNTPSASLNPSDLYGPRSEYLGNPGGNPEQSFPVGNGGQFRTACEFSHFNYDDPLLYPNQPGAAHLHMYFGNTDVNAFSTYDSLLNSGSSTCNGMELNRTGYWVPALIDGSGNVRIPERIVVYYKGEGQARGNSETYPAGAAFIATDNFNALPTNQGGSPGKFSFVCSDIYSANGGASSNTMPNCNGSATAVLEFNVKFPQCWNGQDPSDWNNYRAPSAGWYSSYCTGEFNRTLPNLEYFVNYRVEPGENTSNWFLSSDVEASSFGASKKTSGSTAHGDWWGGWHEETNRMWIDNCVNYKSGSASGCGFGYLTDGGPNNSSPYDGPTLKLRPQYTGPNKVSAATVLAELCPNPRRAYSKPEDAAYCNPR